MKHEGVRQVGTCQVCAMLCLKNLKTVFKKNNSLINQVMSEKMYINLYKIPDCLNVTQTKSTILSQC